MHARVEELAIRFRVPRGSVRAAAELPGLERLMQSRLAEELSAALELVHDASDDVVVVRDATVRVSLHADDRLLDQPALRRVSDAARDAVVALLGQPADDEQVRRFTSGSEYAGTFIVELLQGTAWDRWWLEPFRRFRRPLVRDTLIALLADADTEPRALLAWLERRGRLADVLAIVGAATVRDLALSGNASPGAAPPHELAPLSEAAFAIAGSLGVHVAAARRADMLAEYHQLHPTMPSWRDQAALTAWVWQHASWIMRRARGESPPSVHADERLRALEGLLRGGLDWLDADWLMAQAALPAPVAAEARQLSPRRVSEARMPPSHAALLRGLVARIAHGTLRLDATTEDRDQLVLRMLAAMDHDEAGTPAPADKALLAVLADVADAFLTFARARTNAASGELTSTRAADSDVHASGNEDVRRAAHDPVEAHGTAAIELLRALVSQHDTLSDVATPWAGIFLLVRPIADLRLHLLAERAGAPAPALLAAVVAKLLGVAPPWDAATRLWLGADARPSGADVQGLRTLQPLLLQAMLGQRLMEPRGMAVHQFSWRDEPFVALSDAAGTCWPLCARASRSDAMHAAWRDVAGGDTRLVSSQREPLVDLVELAAHPASSLLDAEREVLVTSIATCVIRAMSRWMPGIAGASAPFLVRNCIQRAGSVAVSDEEIDVVLQRAPLDVVLEMAGCLAPLPETTWLGRRVRFSLAPGHG